MNTDGDECSASESLCLPFSMMRGDMSQLLLFQKVESDGGPFFKVVFKS